MKKSFTLVEILVVMSIVIIMIFILIGILNPIALVNKARDAQRKKDLYRIKISFEDYHNDIGCYPNEDKIAPLLLAENCKSEVYFRPWLSPWPCDPNGTPYEIEVGDDMDCPKWFKILAVLENKNDKDAVANLGVVIGGNEVNYGVSSGNVSVGNISVNGDTYCETLGSCYLRVQGGICNSISEGCAGANCFMGECSARCQVPCCGPGCY